MINLKAGELTFVECRGEETRAYFADLAQLRIGVFREYPYLYDGTLAYEREYLEAYFRSPESYAVLALAGVQVIGASTGMPLREDATHRRVFEAAGLDANEVFYFGESVLSPAWRGQGIGREFFRFREAHAAGLPGIRCCAFCAIERPEGHPRCPEGYRPPHRLWKGQGYRRRGDLVTTLKWRDLDEAEASPKELVFWLKGV